MNKFKKEYIDNIEAIGLKPLEKSFEEFSSDKEASSSR